MASRMSFEINLSTFRKVSSVGVITNLPSLSGPLKAPLVPRG
jgi:hypothetical protein